MPRAFILAIVCVLPWAGFAQQPNGGAKQDEPLKAEVRFMDDSIVRVFLLPEQLEVMTRYGKLAIPVKECQRIEVGVRLPDGLNAKIVEAIEELGSEAYKTRELALKNLIEWGPYAYPRLCKAVKSGEPEVAKRVSAALEKIRAKHPARNLRIREDDVIVTPFFTIVGRISNAQLKTTSKNFGELKISLADLRTIRLSSGPLTEVEVTLDAGKYGSDPNSWMDTGFEVLGNRLLVTATGTVDLWPQGPGYTSQPGGYKQGGQMGQFLAGQLLGRVGENGTPFVIGERYDNTPPGEGKLYLHIVHSPWGNASAGSYQVKISPSSEFGN
jgi:hypothetical protein